MIIQSLKVLALIAIAASSLVSSYIVLAPRTPPREISEAISSLPIQPMTWINVTKTPSPRILAGDEMIFDVSQNRFLLFGGQPKYSTINELWSLDPTTLTWSQLNPPSPLPPGRADSMFAWLSPTTNAPTQDYALLFGGWYNNSVGNVGRLADSWYYFPTNNTWQQMSTHGTPSIRSDSAVAYDPAENFVLMYGGYSGSSYLSDLWAYYPQNETWLQLPSPNLPPLADARMHYDTRNHVFVMFGGNNNLSITEGYNHYNTTYVYIPSTRTWSQVTPPMSPPARDYAQFSYDPDYGLSMLQGGYGDGVGLADTWLFSYVTDTWAQLHPSVSPPARFAGVMEYSSSIKTFVLFGGGINDTALNDTWAFQYTPLIKVTLNIPEPVHAEELIQFSATINANPANIISYLWSFGDGTNSTSTAPNHIYTNSGRYEVRLIVTDSLNESFNSTLTLKVFPSAAGTVVLTLFGAGVLGFALFIVFLSVSSPKKRPDSASQR